MGLDPLGGRWDYLRRRAWSNPPIELGRSNGVDSEQDLSRTSTREAITFFVIRYNSDEFKRLPRDKFIEALNAEGVPSSAAYGVPLYKNPAFKKENLKGIWAKGIGPIPDYESLYLPVAEKFCTHQQVVFPHTVLMADRSGIQMIIDSISKIKDNVEELMK